MTMNQRSMMNKLAFNGYLIRLRVAHLGFSRIATYPYRTLSCVKDLMRNQPHPDYFPTPEEALYIVMMGERGKGITARGHSVVDIQGGVIYYHPLSRLQTK